MVELLQRARAVFHFFFRTLDLPLVGALCLLMVAGLAVLHSVDGPVHAQAMRYGAGLAALWGLSRLPVVTLRAWSPWIYTLSLLPLLAVKMENAALRPNGIGVSASLAVDGHQVIAGARGR